jgi:hypothetical protein
MWSPTVISKNIKLAIWRLIGVPWHTIHAKVCEMLKVSMQSKAVGGSSEGCG